MEVFIALSLVVTIGFGLVAIFSLAILMFDFFEYGGSAKNTIKQRNRTAVFILAAVFSPITLMVVPISILIIMISPQVAERMLNNFKSKVGRN